MDNASKAIIMAGGILIAVAIIGVSLYMITNARELADVSNKAMERSQIESFNRFYYAYAPIANIEHTITGLDACNIYNRVNNNNLGKEEGDYQYIKIDPQKPAPGGTEPSFTNSEEFLEEYLVKITLNSNNGIVDSVTLKKKN